MLIKNIISFIGKFEIYVQRKIPNLPIMFKFTNQIKEIAKCIVMSANQLLLPLYGT